MPYITQSEAIQRIRELQVERETEAQIHDDVMFWIMYFLIMLTGATIAASTWLLS